MSDASITIFHNPACGTSRNVLALIRNSGVEPVIVEYLKTPPGRGTLVELIAAMGVPVRDVAGQLHLSVRQLAAKGVRLVTVEQFVNEPPPKRRRIYTEFTADRHHPDAEPAPSPRSRSDVGRG